MPRYEYAEAEQQRVHRQAIFSSIGQKLLFSLICLLVACGVKFAFQDMKLLLDHFMNVGAAVFSIVETICFLLFTEWIVGALFAVCAIIQGAGQHVYVAARWLACTLDAEGCVCSSSRNGCC